MPRAAVDVPAPDPQPWYVRAFGAEYSMLYRHRDDASADREAARLAKLLGLRPGERVLDVCCGAGRHLAALLRLGLDARGVDLSPDLLAQAADRPGVGRRIVRADVRQLPFDAAFDASINMFTSFGYFDHEADNLAALQSIVRAVRPGGQVLLDLMHPAWIRRTLQPWRHRWIDRRYVRQHRRLAGQRIVNDIEMIEPGGDSRRWSEHVRLYAPVELTAIFRQAGAEPPRFFGALDGRALSDDCQRLIAVGRRA